MSPCVTPYNHQPPGIWGSFLGAGLQKLRSIEKYAGWLVTFLRGSVTVIHAYAHTFPVIFYCDTSKNLPPSHSSMMLNKISGALEPKAINVRFDTCPSGWSCEGDLICFPIGKPQSHGIPPFGWIFAWIFVSSHRPEISEIGDAYLFKIPMLYSTSFPVAETRSNILKNIETISWGLLATQFGRSPTKISWRPAQTCAPLWQFGNLYDLWFEQTMAVTPIVFRIPENGETSEFVQDVPNIYRLLTNKCTVC